MPTIELAVLLAVNQACQEHDVPLSLALAVAWVESKWNPVAKGDYDEGGNPHSYGLFQLYNQGAGVGLPSEQLLDLKKNSQLGVAYLKLCLKAFSDNRFAAISAYNQGVQGCRDRGWDFNREYVEAVLRAQLELCQTGFDCKLAFN